MLTVIIGDPGIDAVDAFAMLVGVVINPALLTIVVQPVSGAGAGGLKTVGRLGNIDGVGSRGQIVETVGTLRVGEAGFDGGTGSVFKGDGNPGIPGINAGGQETVAVAIHEDVAANAGQRVADIDVLGAGVAVATAIHRQPGAGNDIGLRTGSGGDDIAVRQCGGATALVSNGGIAGHGGGYIGDGGGHKVAEAPGAGTAILKGLIQVAASGAQIANGATVGRKIAAAQGRMANAQDLPDAQSVKGRGAVIDHQIATTR